MSKQNIVVSNINREENQKEIILERKIYIDCMCNGINHIGRIILHREIYKDNMPSIFTMWLETNAQSYFNSFYAYNTNFLSKMMLPFQFLRFKFFDAIKRIKMAFKILFNKTIYMPLDWELMGDTILDLAKTIKDSYKEMNKVNGIDITTVINYLKNNFNYEEMDSGILSYIQLNYLQLNKILINARDYAKTLFGNELSFKFELVYFSDSPKLFVHFNPKYEIDFEILNEFDKCFYLKLENSITDLVSFTLGE